MLILPRSSGTKMNLHYSFNLEGSTWYPSWFFFLNLFNCKQYFLFDNIINDFIDISNYYLRICKILKISENLLLDLLIFFFPQENLLGNFFFFACNLYPCWVRILTVLLYSIKSGHNTARSFCCPQIALNCSLVLKNLATDLLYRFINYRTDLSQM